MIPSFHPDVNWYPVNAPASRDPESWHVAAFDQEHAQRLYDENAAEGRLDYGAPAAWIQMIEEDLDVE